MKTKDLVVLSLLFLSLALAKRTTLPQQSTCMSNNIFMSKLSKADIQIFNVPSKDNIGNTCTVEWQKYGTCCESTDIVDHIKYEGLYTKQASDLTSSILKSTIEQISRLVDMIYMQHQLNQQGDQSQGGVIDQFTKLHDTVQIIKSKFNERKNKFGLADFNSEILDDLGKTCWINTMLPMRSQALCSICSGRSKKFFVNHETARVSVKTCSALMNGCSFAFSESVSVAIKVSDLFDALKSLDLRHLRTNKTELMKEINSLHQAHIQFRKNNIPQMLEEYARTGNSNLKNLGRLCKKFLHLGDTPFIVQFASILVELHSGIGRSIDFVSSLSHAILIDAQFDKSLENTQLMQKIKFQMNKTDSNFQITQRLPRSVVRTKSDSQSKYFESKSQSRLREGILSSSGNRCSSNSSRINNKNHLRNPRATIITPKIPIHKKQPCANANQNLIKKMSNYRQKSKTEKRTFDTQIKKLENSRLKRKSGKSRHLYLSEKPKSNSFELTKHSLPNCSSKLLCHETDKHSRMNCSKSDNWHSHMSNSQIKSEPSKEEIKRTPKEAIKETTNKTTNGPFTQESYSSFSSQLISITGSTTISSTEDWFSKPDVIMFASFSSVATIELTLTVKVDSSK